MLRQLLLATLLLGSSLLIQAAPQQSAIATAHPAATAAARQMLEAGGNAFDAAIAASAALAVVEPYGSGIGGGGFFLLRKAGEVADYVFLDARERAPLQADADLYVRNGQVQRQLSLDGALAAAIPGLPAALVELAERHGRLPLSSSLAPAIHLAEAGFAVDSVYRERTGWRLAALRNDAESARLFLDEGNIPGEGYLLRQPELAATLQTLAEHGRAGFYAGPLAERLVDGVRQAGGIWTTEDLLQYQVVRRPPLHFTLDDGRELISAPPPSAGGVALAQSLAILSRLPWREAEPVQRVHYVVEALRRAYRDRSLLGDPDFVDNPLEQLLAPAHLAALAASIDAFHATPSSSLAPATRWHEGDHTTHFAILDREGNAVSATLSINLPFGAAFTVPGTGVLLNNEMDDFAADVQGTNAYGLTGSPVNAVAAGKRPLSSMSPSFIEDGDSFAAFGTPGGSRIPSMVLLAMLEYLDGQPIERWPGVPRYHHQFMPDVLEHEPDTFNATQITELERRGHNLKRLERTYGNQQVLFWDKRSGTVQAASDPRGIGSTATGN
ncbi:gamma-glutamyltransferase [Pseudomonas sp. NCCP-436]|uniref:gamma-glutamyltransferase n=1 Tax=Pseudomonas sp. NCCP-436 TaxID=2842481 RepID=UPI001C7EB9C9|nr:gamma-glutamyltransferase [Pseudomonas sp. NCCP-436]GIZ12555.1 gamma-glutamyltranspeptidase [Pseudomonas sp. NCCP-436]